MSPHQQLDGAGIWPGQNLWLQTMNMATPAGEASSLEAWLWASLCCLFLSTGGNPRSGSPYRAAVTLRRHYFLEGDVLGIRGVFYGCWRCLPCCRLGLTVMCFYHSRRDLQSAMYVITNTIYPTSSSGLDGYCHLLADPLGA
jgi:hypothetical protein